MDIWSWSSGSHENREKLWEEALKIPEQGHFVITLD